MSAAPARPPEGRADSCHLLRTQRFWTSSPNRSFAGGVPPIATALAKSVAMRQERPCSAPASRLLAMREISVVAELFEPRPTTAKAFLVRYVPISTEPFPPRTSSAVGHRRIRSEMLGLALPTLRSRRAARSRGTTVGEMAGRSGAARRSLLRQRRHRAEGDNRRGGSID